MMKKIRREKNLTVLGRETKFDGLLKFSDDLYIEGKFTGAIDAQGDLQISKDSICNVQYIKASSVTVHGTVIGNITAIDKIDLKSGSTVKGNLIAGKLRIADDVEFEGVVNMISDNVEVERDIFSVNADQLKSDMMRT